MATNWPIGPESCASYYALPWAFQTSSTFLILSSFSASYACKKDEHEHNRHTKANSWKKHIRRNADFRRNTAPASSLSHLTEVRRVHATLLLKLHAGRNIRCNELGTMAQSSSIPDKLDRSGSPALNCWHLLPDCWCPSSRLCRKQDPGRSRSCSDDCLRKQQWVLRFGCKDTSSRTMGMANGRSTSIRFYYLMVGGMLDKQGLANYRKSGVMCISTPNRFC